MPIRKITLPFFAAILLFFNSFTYSQNNINILTWNRIFDASPVLLKKLGNIKGKCDININFDYYSNHDDFLEQLSGHDYDYDIVVAPNTFLNLISKYIPKDPNPQLKNITKKYNPYVKKHFDNVALPPNTIYFMQSLTGLLVNNKIVNSNKITNVYNLIHALDNESILLILDDPIELSKVIEKSKNNKTPLLTTEKIIKNISEFTEKTQNKNITIVNFFNRRMLKNNFAAALVWSGAAFIDIQKIKQEGLNSFSFETPQNLSFISSDLILQLNRKNSTDCAIQYLADEDFLNEVAYANNYFSPFINKNHIKYKSEIYAKIQGQYLSYLQTADWLDSIEKDDFNKIHYEWEKFKFNTIKNKNHNS